MVTARFLDTYEPKAATVETYGHPAAGIIGWLGVPDVASKVIVNEDTAMTYSAVWAATRLLCGAGSHLPLNLYRKLDGGKKELATDHPLFRILHDGPNPDMSSMMFRSTQLHFQINWGNAYAEIERDGGGRVVALWPIHPSRVTLKRLDDQTLVYYVASDGGKLAVELAADEVFHVPSMVSDDGIIGKGVIRQARESIGFGIATERYGAGFFGRGGLPRLIIKHTKRLSSEARKNFRREWNEVLDEGNSAGRVALLQEGAEAQPISLSAEDSQFLSTRQHNVEEIARWYGVPPHLIGHLLRSTFNNVEQQSLEFVVYGLIPWLKLWEQEIWRKLLTREEQDVYFAKHVVDALLRGDAQSRASALQTQFLNGALTINQWMEIEDRNPIGPLGDEHFVPLNMTTVERAVSGEDFDRDVRRQAGDKSSSATAAASERATIAERWLSETIERMVIKESKDAKRATRKPDQFLPWMDSFYEKYMEVFAEAVSRPVAAAYGFCNPEVAKIIAVKHVAESRRQLLEASECSPVELPDRVAACVADWVQTRITPDLSEMSNASDTDAA